MLAVYGDAAPFKYQVKCWSKQLKWVEESVKDDPCLGKPVEVTALEMCQKTADPVMQEGAHNCSGIQYVRTSCFGHPP
jgi:hypothetical protein